MVSKIRICLFVFLFAFGSFSFASCYIEFLHFNGSEKECFNILEKHPKENLLKKCLKYSTERWSILQQRDSETAKCCALYDATDCVQQEGSLVCDARQLAALNAYHFKSLNTIEKTICNSVPYNRLGELCKQ